MKAVFAMDSFKSSLTSQAAGQAAAAGLRRVYPDAETIVLPLADGGEGTAAALVNGLGGHFVPCRVRGALGEPIDAQYGLLPDGTAVIETAAAAGIEQVMPDRRNPMRTTTFGAGQLIGDAVGRGCRRFWIGIGGSATNDGGIGMLQALGFGFFNADGAPVSPDGAGLCALARISADDALPALRDCTFRVACDVTNPLCGPNGCSAVFGPQKGADAEKVKSLDAGLRHFGDVIRSQYGLDVSAMPGAGAAGGMGAGCVALLGGTIQSGIDAVLDVTGFDRQLEGADLVITGEGRIDSQSADGKVVSGVARRTRAKGVPLIAIAGGIADSAGAVYDIGVSAMFSTDRAALPVDMLGARSPGDYEATLSDIMSLIAIAERFA